MTNTNATNWDERGIAWERLAVSKRFGPHATDEREIGFVFAPHVINLTAATAHFGEPRVLAWLRASSSFDVRARAWYKALYARDPDVAKHMTPDEQKNAVYQSVLLNVGSRGRIVERETKLTIMSFTRIIKSGEVVTYADLFGEAMAANIDVMVDVPTDVLRIAVAKSLETAGFTPDETDDEDDEAETTE